MATKAVEVTDAVEFDQPLEYGDCGNEDIQLPIRKCICGAAFDEWDFRVALYPELPNHCPKCGRALYFTVKIQVYEVVGNNDNGA